jgi:transposase
MPDERTRVMRRRLMTVPGVNLVVAASFLAAIGNIERFPDRRKRLAYLGLDPKVRQSEGATVTGTPQRRARFPR